MLGNQYHLERRKGTQSQAIEYCKKEKDFAEFGEKKNQGDRGDLKRAGTDALDEGIIFAIMNGANLQSIRYAEKILSYMEDERHWKPKVWWYWGPSGSGKSKRAMKTSKKYRTYWKNEPSKWFDGYDRHECLVLDDVEPSWFEGDGGLTRRLLSITDRYPCRLQVKGGFRQLLAKIIIITSICHPEEYDSPDGELLRRITHVIDVTEVRG